LVDTSTGCGGVTVSAPVGNPAIESLDAVAVARLCTARAPAAAGAGERVASDGSTSPGLGGAVAVVAGCAGVAGWSEGRVTLPRRLKSRSWDGPTVSGDGGGAAVTSTGASLFWAAAGEASSSASAAPAPPKDPIITRPNAVILPRPAVAG
jgi:hypothetical protein